MHTGRLALVIGVSLLLSGCASNPPVPEQVSHLPEIKTQAVRTALKQHWVAMKGVAENSSVGIWVVQDGKGELVASGVAQPFPTTIGFDNYSLVVPAARGRIAESFGFARTERRSGMGPVPVVYITVK